MLVCDYDKKWSGCRSLYELNFMIGVFCYDLIIINKSLLGFVIDCNEL